MMLCKIWTHCCCHGLHGLVQLLYIIHVLIFVGIIVLLQHLWLHFKYLFICLFIYLFIYLIIKANGPNVTYVAVKYIQYS